MRILSFVLAFFHYFDGYGSRHFVIDLYRYFVGAERLYRVFEIDLLPRYLKALFLECVGYAL